HAAVVAREELDTFLGVLEISGAAAGQADSLLEHGEGLFQGEIARLEPVDDLLEALGGVLKCDVAPLAPRPLPPARRALPRAATPRSPRPDGRRRRESTRRPIRAG